MKHARFFLVAIVALQLAFWGCAKDKLNPKEGTSPGINIEGPSTQVRWNSVGVTDDKIAKKIAIQDTNADRTATNTLEVWTLIRNRTDYPLQIEARVQFFDANKKPIEGPTAWKKMFLTANGIQKYSEFSTRTDVSFYYIEIREGI